MIFRLMLVLSLLGCGITSKKRADNQIQFGSVRLFGGVAKNEKWNDTLEFERVSWYQNLTLFYDVLAVNFNETNPFKPWLSDRELDEKKECAKYVIVMLYATIPVRIAHSDFYDQVDQQGWKKLELGDFSKAISRHPSFGDWKLNNYKIMALCHKSMNIRHIDLTFPGFHSIQLNF